MPVNDGNFRLGIIGCGDTSAHHGEALLATEGVRFVACCEVRVERAQEFSDHFGCDAQYDDHLMSHKTTPKRDTLACATHQASHKMISYHIRVGRCEVSGNLLDSSEPCGPLVQNMEKPMIRSVAILLMIGITPFTASADDAKSNYVVDQHGKQPSPVVAIDNVCAWPNLTLTRDGTIIATIHNQPSHLKDPGDVECWASTDRGTTWTRRGISAPRDDEKAARGMFAAGVAKNGNLIVISTGHTDPVAPDRGKIVPTWVSRSKDGGKTWDIDKDGFPRGPGNQPLNPYGDIVPGADGNLHVAAYDSNRTFIFTSRDDGITWTEPAQLSKENPSNETALFHLGGGQWLAAARSTRLDLYVSEDDASTWAHLMKLTTNAEIPGHIVRIKSGLLVSYGNRNVPRGVDVRFGNNDGTTWSEPFRVLDCAGDIGYPSSVYLPDGQMLTAYYAQRIAGHDKYHMGVVVWDPERTQRKLR